MGSPEVMEFGKWVPLPLFPLFLFRPPSCPLLPNAPSHLPTPSANHGGPGVRATASQKHFFWRAPGGARAPAERRRASRRPSSGEGAGVVFAGAGPAVGGGVAMQEGLRREGRGKRVPWNLWGCTLGLASIVVKGLGHDHLGSNCPGPGHLDCCRRNPGCVGHGCVSFD